MDVCKNNKNRVVKHSCNCSKDSNDNTLQNKDSKFEKLSLDDSNNTKIMADYATFLIEQLENEIAY